MDGSYLGGPGVVGSSEVLSVVLVRGDEGQPGVLMRHKTPNGHHTRKYAGTTDRFGPLRCFTVFVGDKLWAVF